VEAASLQQVHSQQLEELTQEHQRSLAHMNALNQEAAERIVALESQLAQSLEPADGPVRWEDFLQNKMVRDSESEREQLPMRLAL